MGTFAKFQQFGPISIGGTIITDGKMLHYAAGMLVAKDIYKDREKTLTQAQPMLMDVNGLLSFYGDGVYDFIILDADDNEIYNFNGVSLVEQSITGLGATLVAASTLVLGSDGNIFHLSGNGTVDSIQGTQADVTFIADGFPVFTHSAGLLLPDSMNINVNASDILRFVNEGNNVWRLVQYSEDKIDLHVQGQVRLVKSGDDLKLEPSALGSRLTIYDGAQWKTVDIGGAGITLADDGLAADTTYYIYCFINSSNAAELEASTTVHIADPNRGVRRKTGDATRLLVGMARTNGSAEWTDSATQRFVRSWFSDPGVECSSALSSDVTTVSSSYSELSTSMRHEFLTWANERIDVQANFQMIHSMTEINLQVGIGLDSTTDPATIGEVRTSSPPSVGPFSESSRYNAVVSTEGYHYAAFLGLTGSGTLTWEGSARPVTDFRTFCTSKHYPS